MKLVTLDDDTALLRQYATHRDPDAFERLARRYAAMVYAVAFRITGSSHDAEDVAQNCMLELARRASTIRSSLAGWLHTAATHRAQNMLRGNHRRRKHEAGAAMQLPQAEQPTWSEIEPLIDAALSSLPEALRDPIVLHYLRGLNQVQVAQELGLSQATVSRRLKTGVERLREALRLLGVGTSITLLDSGLSQAQAMDIPATLQTSLGKLALAGIESTQQGTYLLSQSRQWSWWPVAATMLACVTLAIYVPRVNFESTAQIPDVPTLKWGALHDGSTTFVGALAAAARAQGADTNYTRLMGDSGLAFTSRWYRCDGIAGLSWNGLSAFGDGKDERSLIESSLGMRVHRIAPFGWTQARAAEYHDEISLAIRSGQPLIAQDGNRIRCCLIIGQDKSHLNRLKILHYGEEASRWESLDVLGGLAKLEKGDSQWTRRAAVIAAIRKAVSDWTRPPQAALAAEASWTEPQATIFYGQQAFNEWIRDTQRSVSLDEQLARQIWEASWWNYDLYCDARFQAAKYLRESALLFEGKIAAALTRAAAHYHRLETEGLVDSVYQNPQGPFTHKTFSDWTPAARREEVTVFRRAAAIDASAMRELRVALQAIQADE